MTKRQTFGFSVVSGVVFASVVGPILISLNMIQPYILYSLFTPFENAFFSAFAAGFSVATLAFDKKYHGKANITPTNIIYSLISIFGFQTMGIYILSMLWLVPWWAQQFDEEDREHLPVN